MEDPKHNLSDYEFFFFYVKHENWNPMQNHGLYTDKIEHDWSSQINAYLNLFKDIEYKNKKILDLGCGWGRGVDIIYNNISKNIIGSDINYDFIKYAKNKYNKSYILDDFLNTSFKNSSFDMIISNCSLHFFYNKDAFFINIKDVLKQDGMLIVSDFFDSYRSIVFEEYLKKNQFNIMLKEDLSIDTIKAMEYDINTLNERFSDKVSLQSINAFIEIQKHRLYYFNKNDNKQYKYIITK
jgi:ubiquinone/menaquinone biosynthesis C-methylase UbiE